MRSSSAKLRILVEVADGFGLAAERPSEVAGARRLQRGRIPHQGRLHEAGPGLHRADVENDALGHVLGRSCRSDGSLRAGRAGCRDWACHAMLTRRHTGLAGWHTGLTGWHVGGAGPVDGATPHD
jgi:hypothetical protein